MSSRFYLALLLAVAPLLALADVAEMAAECDSCHGENGVSRCNDVPTIAGMSAFAHADAFFFYKDEARPCHETERKTGHTSRPATDMCRIAADMSEDQIEAIADHYAAKPFVPAKQPFDESLAAQGKVLHEEHCERCHTDGGSNPEDDAGILAGQWMGYLRQSFADYNSGNREQSKNMSAKMEKLNDKEFEALLHFYAAQQ